MNHAITVGGLLLSLGLLAGLLASLGGFMAVLAEGMSDAPSADNGKSGCAAIIVGLILMIGCAIGLLA
jgi:hypothetical protein